MSTVRRTAVAVVVLAVLAGAWAVVRDDARTVVVRFPSAAALYVGNPVEVLGVPVGQVLSVTPRDGDVEVVLEVDEDVALPADVHVFQVSPSLISGRSIALAPAYVGGDRLEDGAVVPEERAHVPLDVNDLYESTQEVAAVLGPQGANEDGALSRALDVFAANLDGNGDALAAAVRDLAAASGTLSGGRGELAGTVRGLQTFVETLADQDDDVERLNGQLAAVSDYLAADRTELAAALATLARSLGEVAAFVDDNRSAVRAGVTRLSRVTKVLVRNRRTLAELLDEAPTGLGNLLNSYNAAGGTLDVRIDANELDTGPGRLLCDLLSRGAPTSPPDPLLAACRDAAGPVDSSGAPTLAELLALLQGGAPAPGAAGGRR